MTVAEEVRRIEDQLKAFGSSRDKLEFMTLFIKPDPAFSREAISKVMTRLKAQTRPLLELRRLAQGEQTSQERVV